MVDCALNEARSTLLTAGQPDAAVPVLFMRLKSGQLWEVETKAEAEAGQDVTDPRIPPPPDPIALPETPGFVGREAELTAFTHKLAETNLAVITGMPGVGKTALASVLARRVGDPKKTFWHTFYPNEGLESIIWKLAGFLYWHDQRDLWEMLQRTVMSGGKPPPTRDLMDYSAQLLRQQDYALCMDNVHLLSEDDATLLGDFVQRLLLENIVFILVGQSTPIFESPGRPTLLTGLSLEETRDLLTTHGLALPEDLESQVHARTEGNPQLLILSVQILKRARDPAKVLEHLAAVDDIEIYLVKEVDEKLSGDDREVMIATAILLGYPGTRDAIETIADRRRIKKLILQLSNQHLLQVQEGEEEEEYTEHTIVREFYYDVPSRRERQEMHRRAAEYYAEEHGYTKKPQDL
jgi:hypothetical protein